MRDLESIDKAILSSINIVVEKMKNHEGVFIALSEKLTFEKWLQIELAGLIQKELSDETNLRVFIEAPVSEKTGKRAQSIDIAILKNDQKFFGIELKMLVTNYSVDNLTDKTKGITDKVNEMIDDFGKLLNDGYNKFVSIGFVYPIRKDKSHRNNSTDFPKQLKKAQ